MTEHSIFCTLYEHERNPAPVKSGSVTFTKLVASLEKHDIRPGKSGRAWAPHKLKPGTTRANENVECVTALVLDCDGGIPLEQIRHLFDGLAYVAHSSHSHTPAKPKHRVVVALSRPVSANEWPEFWRAVVARFDKAGPDRACADPARLYYLPSCPEDTAAHAWSTHQEGEALDVDTILAEAGTRSPHPGPYSLDNPPEFAKTGTLAAAKTTHPPSSAELVADRCAQIGGFKAGAAQSEPLWRASLSVVARCEGGAELAHTWSAHDERYSPDETQAKIDGTAGPATCAQFQALNPPGCAGCQHTCRSPIQLGEAGTLAVQDEQDEQGWLAEMNREYAFIIKEAAIYRRKHGDFITPERFHMLHANRYVATGHDKKPQTKSIAWLRSPGRAQFRELAMRPGEPEETHDGRLNAWAGFAVTPKPGDVTPFLRLGERLSGDQWRYKLTWLAHLFQFPGVKMFTSQVVWSEQQGVGKNLFYETLGQLLHPRHFALIGQSEIEDDFSGWMVDKVLVIADEIRVAKTDKARNRLKLWATATTLQINEKFQPKRSQEHLANFVYLMNHDDGMSLDDYDRRYAITHVTAGPLPAEQAREFVAWRDNGGLSHLLHYLQQVDLTGFDPKGRAPVTDAKREMVAAGRSDLDQFCFDAVSDALALRRQVATADELLRRFMAEYPHTRTPPSVALVGRIITRAGAYRRETQVRLSSGRKVRALALTRPEFWKKQPESAWRDELEKPL